MKNPVRSLTSYFSNSFSELKKVTWPTKQQSVRLTFIVLGFCLISAFVVGIVDLIFSQGYMQLVLLSK